MDIRRFDAPDAPQPAGGYAQAVEVAGAQRLLFVSGQIPVDSGGAATPDFTTQCRLAWANVEPQLRAADMGLDNLLKVTIFLGDRAHAPEDRAIRQAVLGDRRVAMTVIITGIFHPAWMLEIEAVAAA